MFLGAIFVDNQNIEHIHLESLRRHIGLVSQDTVSNLSSLFPDSVPL